MIPELEHMDSEDVPINLALTIPVDKPKVNLHHHTCDIHLIIHALYKVGQMPCAYHIIT